MFIYVIPDKYERRLVFGKGILKNINMTKVYMMFLEFLRFPFPFFALQKWSGMTIYSSQLH